MTGFLDWLGRVIFLVLAGMVTLSLIGALAAIPAGVVPTRIGIDQRPRPLPQAQQAPLPSQRPTDPRPTRPDPQAKTSRTVMVAPAPPPPEPIDPARWLEAITYALLALVGLAALACLLLWRGLRDRRRIAAALEALGRARP